MTLIGSQVEHRKFGSGVISECAGNIVTVSFSEGKKKFIYPDAFKSFLILKSDEKQQKVLDVFKEKEEEKMEKLHKKMEKEERRDRLLSIKLTPQSQAVFNLRREELLKAKESLSVSSGKYLSGNLAGEPKIPNKLKPNSLCIFTCCDEGQKEEEREIKSLFMVSEDFYGSRCFDGNITLHPKFNLTLPDDIHVTFWDKLDKENCSHRFGKSPIKYIKIHEAKNIVDAALSSLEGKDEEEACRMLSDYFYKINHI